MPETHLTAAAVAAKLGLSPSTVSRHAAAGKFRGATRYAGAWRIPARYAVPDVYRAAVGPARGVRAQGETA